MELRNYLRYLLWLIPFTSIAQTDTIISKNDNLIVGEIKSLSKGVLTVETDYSKSDFTIEWTGIKKIYSKANFMITLQNRDRLSGSIRSADSENKVIISSVDGKQVEVNVEDIVYLKGFKSKFWSRTYGGVDLGINLTKANDLKQYSIRSALGYLGNNWQYDIYYDDMRSSQDSVESTKRTEFGISAKHFFRRGWYVFASLDFLSNTEQALDMRATGKLGGGNFIYQTNKAYWGLVGGVSSNNETFTNETEKRSSVELFAGSEINLFDVGDLSLLNKIYVYPSLTESGRWRVDLNLDLKYDLPLDLYFKIGLTLNYDNRPVVAGKETDYVFVFSVGWEFNK
jgi:hypothetical protein